MKITSRGEIQLLNLATIKYLDDCIKTILFTENFTTGTLLRKNLFHDLTWSNLETDGTIYENRSTLQSSSDKSIHEI